MKLESHQNSLLTMFVRFISVLFAVVFFLYGVFYLVIGIIALMNVSEYGFLPFLNGLIYFGVLGFFAPVFFMLIRDLHTPVIVDKTGLHSKLFGKSLDVNWQDVIGVRPVILFGVLKLRNKYAVVTKGSLPFLHRLYGVLFGGVRRPLLPINPSLNDDPKLIEKISRRAKQNRQLESK